MKPLRVDSTRFGYWGGRQMRSAHAARVIEMRERPFEELAPSSEQARPAAPANPSPIRIDRIARRCLINTALLAAIGLADVDRKPFAVHSSTTVRLWQPLSPTTSSAVRTGSPSTSLT